jgi:hypothetical protein
VSAADQTQPGARTVSTRGGAYFEGGVSVPGGTFVARDQYVNYQFDLAQLITAMRQALPPSNPAPQRLLDALREFRRLHERLFEWKELHNYLNDVVITVDQFATSVERWDASGQLPPFGDLSRQWRPVGLKLDLLLGWAASVKHVASVPFADFGDGRLAGPPWAVDLAAARRRLDELLERQTADLKFLYEATAGFVDAAALHMYLVDKHLRDTAGELYALSQVVLGQLSHDDVR